MTELSKLQNISHLVCLNSPDLPLITWSNFILSVSSTCSTLIHAICLKAHPQGKMLWFESVNVSLF